MLSSQVFPDGEGSFRGLTHMRINGLVQAIECLSLSNINGIS
jgi:hypothetical protein